jgi:hypothetical protein
MGTHRNKIFWLLFVILGATLISGMITSVFYIDVLLGLLLVIIGLYKFGEEFITDNIRKDQQRFSEDIENVMEWLTHSYEFTKRLKDTHESRIHHLDSKRAEMNNRIDKNYREMVRKIIEVENKLNKTSKEVERERNLADRVDKLASLLVRERRMLERKLFDVTERQHKALRMARDRGRITTGDYVKRFGVRDKTALAEINELVRKGFLRKRGKGRAVHYVLGF